MTGVNPRHITLALRTIGHLVGPTGPRSTLGYHEYVERASLEFRIFVVRDSLTPGSGPTPPRVSQFRPGYE